MEQYNTGNKLLYYFADFEIINEEMINIFQTIGIIQKEKLIKGEYIAGEKKIFFHFKMYNRS